MFPEITLFEILSFLRQAGLALTGASCLWGLYFYLKHLGEEGGVFLQISEKMKKPLTAGILVSAVAWIGISMYSFFEALLSNVIGFLPVLTTGNAGIDALQSSLIPYLHEGITLAPTLESTQNAVAVFNPVFLALLAFYIGGMLYSYVDRESFEGSLGWFYGIGLLLSSVIISFPVWQGGLNAEKLFFIGHSWHSILTVGTVIVLDYLLIITNSAEVYERHIYPVLPDISKAIWIGLAIEFLSVGFIFHEAIAPTTKMMFMQTVIGIIILNGVFLAGPIAQKMISTIKPGRIKDLSPGWELAAGISGSISIASWLTVTFVDVLHDVQVGYLSLFWIYLGFIAVSFGVYEFLEHYKVGR